MLQVIYDNSGAVSPKIVALIGIENFGKLIFRRRTLLSHFQAAVAAADLRPPVEISSQEDWRRFEVRLRGDAGPEERYLVCPSHVVSRQGAAALTLFLRQARYAPTSLFLPVEGPGSSGWLLLSGAQLREYLRGRTEGGLPAFLERHGDHLARIEDRLGLIDLDDETALLKYLSGTFDVRFFNAISADDYVITKRSADAAKLEREFNFYSLLPPLMRMFFLEPFDFSSDGDHASYRMERLHVPDMALQWLHGALDQDEFGRFLDQIFRFVAVRARRPASPENARRQIDALFVDKVQQRISQLKDLPEFAALKPLIEPVCGSIDALAERYFRALAAARRRFPIDYLVIGHGDLCFSNILYSKTSQIMKLIDPRGAAGEADLYTNPYYDLAKLSHSVLGSYDHINQDMFDVQVDEKLNLSLVLDRQPPEWAGAMFENRLREIGYDPLLVRLCEASLFISMLPLHIDRPRKVLGFVIKGVEILDQVESSL